MAVAWPATLPAPLRAGLTVTPNPDVKARITQSGRKELRRWGKGGGDTLTCTLRLWNNHPAHGDQVAKFKRYWSRDLNMGLNWINADWLETGLGYAACYLRIIGYSQRRAVGTLYSDYSVSFNIRPVASAWTDTEWPSGSSGASQVTARSVVFDFANNWGSTSQMGVRRFEFSLDGTVRVIGESDATFFHSLSVNPSILGAKFAFLTAGGKTGQYSYAAWLASSGGWRNQRIIIVFNAAVYFNAVIFNNYHNSGAGTTLGVRNVTITVTPNIYTTTTYSAAVTNGQVIFSGELPVHPATNIIQDYLVPLSL